MSSNPYKEQVQRLWAYIISTYSTPPPQSASGGYVSPSYMPQFPVRNSAFTGRPGMSGFDGAEPGLALGTVRGVRMWSVLSSAAERNSDGLPVIPDRRAPLVGATGRYAWMPGENTASCNLDNSHAPPEDGCGCGFWAYWEWDGYYHVSEETAPVLGVIEGYGRTFTGTKGFRCEKARLIALAPVFAVSRGRGSRYGIELAEYDWMTRFRNWLSDSWQVPVYDSHRLMMLQHKTGEITV